MGARGNSGVILSQLIRGFQVANKKNKNFNTANLAESLRKASEIAYQGVLKPVEGTILTVSRKAADGAEMALKKPGSGRHVGKYNCLCPGCPE